MMRKNLDVLLMAILAVITVSGVSYAFTNPLQKYNLYEDTHKNGAGRQGVMSESFYNIPSSNSTSTYNPASNAVPSTANISSKPVPTAAAPTDTSYQAEVPQRRNDYLRESSKKRFGETSPGWLEGPSFYANPTLESIKAKYKASNFAGCRQEAESYVRLHPSDTLGFYYLAMSYAKTGDKDNAVLAYEKVISLHDNPMIVKYATNGRNCVMSPSEETCYPRVNEPEYVYPYAHVADGVDMTLINPQTLINRNISNLQAQLSPQQAAAVGTQAADENGNIIQNAAKQVNQKYPFTNQDADLDAFINAPYGSGMSAELEQQYKQMKLKELQQNLNNSEEVQNLKDFDSKKKSEIDNLDSVKLAYDSTSVDDVMEKFSTDSEVIQAQKELDEIKMLFGDNESKKSDSLTDLLPSLLKNGENVSPEVIQALMMQSIVPDIVNIDN